MKHLIAEIADTPFSHQQGLMFREHLNDDSCMIFIFKNADNLRFWGFNTFIPLDIAFVSPENIITEINHIKPLCTDSVKSIKKCDKAIETNMGFFSKNNIKAGEKIDIISRDNGQKWLLFLGNSNET